MYDISEYSVMLWAGHGHDELSEGSLEKPVSSAVYFYDAGSSAVGRAHWRHVPGRS